MSTIIIKDLTGTQCTLLLGRTAVLNCLELYL